MVKLPKDFRPPSERGLSKNDFGIVHASPLVQRSLGRKYYEQGIEHTKAGRWKNALRDFKKAVNYAPDQTTYNYVLGVALTHERRFEDALQVFYRELTITPDHPSTLTEIGTCLARLGQYKEGIGFLERGLSQWPQMPYAQFSLGLALLKDNRTNEAIDPLTRALTLNPSYVDGFRARGFAYTLKGEKDRAMDDFCAAAALDNKDYNVLISLGIRLETKARNLDAGILLEAAAKIAPENALPQSAFGMYLINRNQCELGLTYVERSLELDPHHPNGHVARGFGFLGQGRVDEAVQSYIRAGELAPTDAGIAGSLLFALQHKPGVMEADLFNAHRKWAKLYRPDSPKDRLDFSNDPDPMRRPRIGLVSADLRAHAVTFLILRAIEQLAANGYDIFCYKTDDKYKDDKYTDRYKAIAKDWTDVSQTSDIAFAELIAEHKVDILIDLSGHTMGNRLSVFAKRAAPIQLSWAGYVGTVGLDTYDGIIADPVEVPASHDEFYVEPIIRLPECYVCFEPPAAAPDVGPLPALKSEYFTFGCFNRPAKLNIEVATAWAKILEKVPNGRILMAYGSFKEEGTKETIYKLLESGGVARDRVELRGLGEQIKLLRAYNEIDLALDPFPYSGGVTTLESIWMGVPVVTLIGNTFAGRHSASHLTAAGLSEFCTSSISAYVDLAASWSGRLGELAVLRAGLREQMAVSPLVDAVRFAHHFGEALMPLWANWCALRQAPTAIVV